jgi:hypothetical protein
MRRKLAESGVSENQEGLAITPQDYQALRIDLEKKRRQIEKVETYLRNVRKFDMLYAVAKQVGLNWATLTNLEECKPKLLSAWTGEKSLMNEFINYLEWVQERLEIDGKLSDIRNGKVKVVDASKKAEPNSATEVAASIPIPT